MAPETALISLLLPDKNIESEPLFESEEDFDRFREDFMDAVIPIQEKWLDARRRSEEEARQRLLR